MRRWILMLSWQCMKTLEIMRRQQYQEHPAGSLHPTLMGGDKQKFPQQPKYQTSKMLITLENGQTTHSEPSSQRMVNTNFMPCLQEHHLFHWTSMVLWYMGTGNFSIKVWNLSSHCLRQVELTCSRMLLFFPSFHVAVQLETTFSLQIVKGLWM